ncbi:MAG: DVUA0089 family protein [Scytolyngbya sp. HA4215-MV1]|nr:DVUA0089 family protein [Scytolyngbya sp. HA4215-MV1]
MKSFAFYLRTAGIVGIACLSVDYSAKAQIVPDNTLVHNSRVTPGCVICTIEGGTLNGSNLFHSFQEFSIPTGGEAWFNNPLQVQNILTRVTGTHLSNIDGLIRANGTANLFLLNPNGIVFGPNAQLQIGGSFSASTAESFQFGNGLEFSATHPRTAPLLQINLTPGLQYGPSRAGATIANSGSLIVPQDLTLVADRLTLMGQLIAGRNLTLQAQDTVQIRDGAWSPFLSLSGGNTLIQGNQGIDIFAFSSPVPAFQSYGNLTLVSGGTISADAHFLSGGNLAMLDLAGNPGQFVSLYDPIILVNGDVVFGDYTGPALKVEATGSITAGRITITGPDLNFAGIPTTIGNVSITASATNTIDSVTISNGFDSNGVGAVAVGVLENFLGLTNTLSTLGNGTATEGSALRATFTVPAGGLTAGFIWNFITNEFSGSAFNDFAFVSLAGPGTNLTTTLRSASAAPATSPFQQVLAPGNYTLGIGVVDVLDTAVDSSLTVSNFQPGLTLSNDPDAPLLGRSPALILRAGATINSSFTALPTTAGGTTFNGSGIVSAGSIQVQGIRTSSAIGSGGSVILDAKGGNISLSSFGKQPSFIDSSSSVVDRTGGNISLTATGNISLPNTRILSTGLAGTGNVTIAGANVFLSDGTVIDAGAIGSDGTSGNVSITALNGGQITLDKSAIITSINTGALPSRNTTNAPSEGNITLIGGSISLTRSVLNASTSGGRDGGDVLLEALTGARSVSLDDESAIVTTVGVQAGDPTGATIVQGGNIDINTGTLSLTQGSSLQAQNLSNKNTRSGNITLNVLDADNGTTPALNIAGVSSTRLPSGIFASNEATISAPDGGNILVNVPLGTMSVSDRAVLSTQNQSDIKGGSITANVQNLQVRSGGQFITSTTGSGDAGDILVTATGTVDISGAATPYATPLVSPFNQPGAPTTISFGTFKAPNGDPTIAPNIEASDRYQYQTVTANGTGNFVYYAFDVAIAGTQGIFDIDGDVDNNNVRDTGAFDTELFLFNAITGELLAQNDDFDPSAGGRGSSPNLAIGGRFDSYINYVFSAPGTYVLGVGKFNSFVNGASPFIQGSTPAPTNAYNLQVSLEAPGTSQGLIPNQGNNSGLFALSQGLGRGGNITIQAAATRLSNNAEINASASASGDGGGVHINAGSVELDNARINASTSGLGNGGSVSINAGSGLVSLRNNSEINASTESFGIGGNIAIAAGSFSLTSSSALNATTIGEADGGFIDVTATNSGNASARTPILIVSDGSTISTGVVRSAKSAFGTGVGGDISLIANNGSIVLNNLALVNASTTGEGLGGDILVQATDGGSLSITNGSRIEAQSQAEGAPGNIHLDASDITISGSALWGAELLYSGLYVAAENQNTAQGGSITINSAANPGNTLVITDGAVLSALNRSVNPGGNITLDVNDVKLLNGGQIVTTAEGTGKAGDITLNVTNLTIAGMGQFTGRQNLAGGTGQLNEIEANDSLSGAQAIGNNFSLVSDPNIESSLVIPHVTVRGTGNNTFDYYAVNVTTGNRAIFDIDGDVNNDGIADPGALDTQLFLFDSDGNVLAENDDFRTTAGGRGSFPNQFDVGSRYDSYIDYTFMTPGTYYIGVGQFFSFANGASQTPLQGNRPNFGDNYTLQVSIDQRNTRNANQGASSGLFAQSTGIGGLAGNITVNAKGTGQVTLNNGAQISASNVSGAVGSDILFNGVNTLQASDSVISASTIDGVAGSVRVNPNAAPASSLTLTNSRLIVEATGIGDAGQVDLNTRQLTLQQSAISASTRSGTGNGVILSNLDQLSLQDSFITASTVDGIAGDLLVNDRGVPASSITLNNGFLTVQADGTGDAGLVSLNTRQLDLRNSLILASTRSGTGKDVVLSNLDQLNLNRSYIVASTVDGVAGDVLVNNGSAPASTLTLSNGSTLESSATGLGDGFAGNIQLNTRQLTLQDNSIISAATAGRGSAGLIQVDAAGTPTVAINLLSGSRLEVEATGAGDAGFVSLSTHQLTLSQSSIAASTVFGSGVGVFLSNLDQLDLRDSYIAASTIDGVAGDLLVNNGGVPASTLTLNHGFLTVGATGQGRGGLISLNARQVSLRNSLISASTGSGVGIGIDLQGLDTLQLSGSQIVASTRTGQAGDVSIAATGEIDLRNNSLLSVGATDGGIAGNLTITADRLTLRSGSQATVSSPRGQAGNLSIVTNHLLLNQGTLSAETSGAGGNGANIDVQVLLTPLLMRFGSLISASANGLANGGNITIVAPFILGVLSEDSDIEANAVQGQGGKINITTNAIFGLQFQPQDTPRSDITASSRFGLSGTVTLNTLDIDPSQGLIELPSELVDPTNQISQECSSNGQSAAKASRFTVTGRGGLPNSPNDPFTGDRPLVEPIDPVPSNNSSLPPTSAVPPSPPNEIIEAQGWVIDAKGEVSLVADAPNVTPTRPVASPATCQPRDSQQSVERR